MRIEHFFDKNLHLVKKAYTIHCTGCIAQLVEQLTLNQWVQGSSPCASTRNKKPRKGCFYFCRTAGQEASQRSCSSTMSLCLQTQVWRTQYECGTGIYAEPVPVRPPEIKSPERGVFCFYA